MGHFPGDRIQCATIMPGALTPTFILVNDDNEVFTLQRLAKSKGWKTSKMKADVGAGRKRISQSKDRMAIVAKADGTVRMFWIEKQAGMLLDVGSEPNGRPSPIADFPFH